MLCRSIKVPKSRRQPLWQKVNKRLSIFDHSHRPRAARRLTCVLLFLFAYGATAEAVHTHGVVAGIPRATADVVRDSGGTSSTKGPARPGDCLICQFQQNLASAETFTPMLEPAPARAASTVQVSPVSFLSLVRSTGQGRAPPVTS
jgi:hypothetical protein